MSETSAVRVARRRRTDMVMQASMWVLGVAAVERRSVVGMRGTETAVGAREPARRPTAIHTLPPSPQALAFTRREAGSTHTLPRFLGHKAIPYRAKIRNPACHSLLTHLTNYMLTHLT